MLIPSWNLNPRLLDPTRRNFDLVSGMGLRICIFNNFSGDADVGSPAATWRTTVQAGCVDGMGLPSGVQHSGRAVGGRTYIQDQTGEHLLFAQARLESPMSMGSGHPLMTLNKHSMRFVFIFVFLKCFA